MNLFRQIIARIGLSGAFTSLLCVYIGGSLLNPIFGGGLINRSYDYPFGVRPQIPVSEVVIVYLDDQSHDRLQQPYSSPWDRGLHAKLLDRLIKDGAKAVVFDILFSDLLNEERDKQLAAAIRRHGTVILASDWTVEDAASSRYRVNTPHELFFDKEEDLGLSEMQPDQDFYVRRHFSKDAGTEIPAMSRALAKRLNLPIAQHENAAYETRWINYYGPPGYIPNVSFYQAISDDLDAPPPGFFKDKVVFVGARILTYMSGQRKDEYRTPYSYWLGNQSKFVPGVDIHATQFLNLLRGDWLVRFSRLVELNVLFISGLLLGFLLPRLRPMQAIASGAVCAAGVTVAAYYLFKDLRILFPWLLIVAVQIPIAVVMSVSFRFYQELKQRIRMQQSLEMYVSPAVAKQVSRSPEMLKPGATKQEVSVLFSDIANFTSMSEGMDPTDLATLMNNYFEGAVNECIQKTDGTVVKFIGDAIFAIWNAPLRQEDHRVRACQGAILLRDKVTDFDFKKPTLEGLDVRTRIGLHCGEASVGNFGSTKRVDYTAFGENINLTSRMEGLNKYVGTSILATGDIINPVKDRFVTRFLGKFVLKGFAKDVEVYELIGTPETAEETRAWRELFAEGLKQFQARDWDGAETIFRRILEKRPTDGPCKFYLKQVGEMRAESPDADWQGEIELKEK